MEHSALYSRKGKIMTTLRFDINLGEKRLLKAALAYKRLCLAYRLGKTPSESLFKQLEKADETMEFYKDFSV